MSREILGIPPPPADARIAYGTDPYQFADLRLPEGAGPHPVAILIHGGFWRAAYNLERSEERRVGKECRSRWSPYH